MFKNIGFIGLGVMGYHIASHLIKKKKKIHIIKRDSIKTKKFIDEYKKSKLLFSYSNLNELAINCDCIISCVGNDNDLKNIYLSKNGIFYGIKKNSFIVDHTTGSPELSKQLSNKFKKKNVTFFDAPMSGGEIGAKLGTLSLMIGGNKQKYLQIKKILKIYSKSLVFMGKNGSGQLTKMVNQICVASVIQGLAEALFFAKKKELKIDNLIQVIKNGAGQSWQLENRALTMWDNKFNFGFMNKLMLKDLNLISDEIKNTDLELPVTKIIKKNYEKLIKLGFEKEDTSNLIRLLNKKTL